MMLHWFLCFMKQTLFTIMVMEMSLAYACGVHLVVMLHWCWITITPWMNDTRVNVEPHPDGCIGRHCRAHDRKIPHALNLWRSVCLLKHTDGTGSSDALIQSPCFTTHCSVISIHTGQVSVTACHSAERWIYFRGSGSGRHGVL